MKQKIEGGMKEVLIEIYTKALMFSRKANQVVGEKHDYYITMEQLERLIKPMTTTPIQDISQCPNCLCMTKTVKGKCGKCKEIKSTPIQETEEKTVCKKCGRETPNPYGECQCSYDEKMFTTNLRPLHIVPNNDIIPHTTIGGNCWCKPRFENTGVGLWIHSSGDKRELLERKAEKTDKND